jgi:hypothetical protein
LKSLTFRSGEVPSYGAGFGDICWTFLFMWPVFQAPLAVIRTVALVNMAYRVAICATLDGHRGNEDDSVSIGHTSASVARPADRLSAKKSRL